MRLVDIVRLDAAIDISPLLKKAMDAEEASPAAAVAVPGTDQGHTSTNDAEETLDDLTHDDEEPEWESGVVEVSGVDGCGALPSAREPVADVESDEPAYAEFDPEDVPLHQVVIAFANVPQAEPKGSVRHAVTSTKSRVKATASAQERNRAYQREKRKRLAQKARAERVVPNMNIDAKLSKLWSSCTAIKIAAYDFMDIETTASCYSGAKGRRLARIPRCFAPFVSDLVVAGFTLVRWNAGYVVVVRLVFCGQRLSCII